MKVLHIFLHIIVLTVSVVKTLTVDKIAKPNILPSLGFSRLNQGFSLPQLYGIKGQYVKPAIKTQSINLQSFSFPRSPSPPVFQNMPGLETSLFGARLSEAKKADLPKSMTFQGSVLNVPFTDTPHTLTSAAKLESGEPTSLKKSRSLLQKIAFTDTPYLTNTPTKEFLKSKVTQSAYLRMPLTETAFAASNKPEMKTPRAAERLLQRIPFTDEPLASSSIQVLSKSKVVPSSVRNIPFTDTTYVASSPAKPRETGSRLFESAVLRMPFTDSPSIAKEIEKIEFSKTKASSSSAPKVATDPSKAHENFVNKIKNILLSYKVVNALNERYQASSDSFKSKYLEPFLATRPAIRRIFIRENSNYKINDIHAIYEKIAEVGSEYLTENGSGMLTKSNQAILKKFLDYDKRVQSLIASSKNNVNLPRLDQASLKDTKHFEKALESRFNDMQRLIKELESNDSPFKLKVLLKIQKHHLSMIEYFLAVNRMTQRLTSDQKKKEFQKSVSIYLERLISLYHEISMTGKVAIFASAVTGVATLPIYISGGIYFAAKRIEKAGILHKNRLAGKTLTVLKEATDKARFIGPLATYLWPF